MKCFVRKIAVALLAVMIFSALAGYTYAANTTFNDFTVTGHAGSYISADSPSKKTDSSAMVIYINSSSIGSSYNVRVMGSGSSILNAENCTVYNSIPADHVVCGKNTYYGIKNTVIEDGYKYASPSLMQGTAYGTVSGKWAPDSAQSYATPCAP